MTGGNGRVCVIGAGISGLVTAKVLSGDGFDVAVFEKETALGGVWAPSRAYLGLRANSACETYCFSDHPYPGTADVFPSAEQVRAYLRSYAERFGIIPRIALDTEVMRVSQNAGAAGWQVTVRKTAPAHTQETLDFAFVVVCNGVFSKPKLPAIADLKRFEGRVLHSSEFTDPACVKGKRVVVVGAGKSAIDCAIAAAREATSSTLLFRRPQWMLPRYLIGPIKTEWLMRTRALESLMPYYNPTRAEAWLHGKARLLVRLMERGLFEVARLRLRMPPELTPAITPIARAFESAGLISDFYKHVRDGSIATKRGCIARTTGGDTFRLDDGGALHADVAIFATGWRQEAPFLDEALRARIERDGRFHLYRTILPPGLPTLGFVGYNSSIASQLTSEIAAHWLSDVFLGRPNLPDEQAMDEDIARMHCWLAETLPAHREGYFVGPFVLHHIDDLMRDMGLSARRRRNVLAENLLPMWSSHYASIAEERRRRNGIGAGL